MALIISTKRNTMKTSDKPYMFHTAHSGIVEQEELVRLMAQDNTTLTSADVRACLDVLERVASRLLADGKRVRTPFGLLYLTASGTAAAPDEPFLPGSEHSGHRLLLNFRQDRQFAASVIRKAQFRRGEYRDRYEPVIYEVSVIDEETRQDNVTGQLVKITGRNLSVEPAKRQTGVFFTAGDIRERADLYVHISPSLLVVKVPERLTDDLINKNCTVQVCTFPRNYRTLRRSRSVSVL